MSIVKAFATGLKRVVNSPAVVFWLYLASVILALPLAWAMKGILEGAIGSSLVHEKLRQGFDLAWYGEFSFERRGLATSFGPDVIGILPVLSNLERLLDGQVLQVDTTIFLAGGVFLLAWAFFAGGILDRYARSDEPYSRGRFFTESGEYFFRFVRLLLLAILIYWGIFRWVAPALNRWLENATRDVAAERTQLAYALGFYAVVGLLLVLVNVAFDYAKIALVVEQRRSAVLAFLRGLGFLFSHLVRTLSLYFLLVLVGLVLVGVYALVAPGPGQSRVATIALAFLLGQAYLVARLLLKLWFLASQTALFQAARPASEMASTPLAQPTS